MHRFLTSSTLADARAPLAAGQLVLADAESGSGQGFRRVTLDLVEGTHHHWVGAPPSLRLRPAAPSPAAAASTSAKGLAAETDPAQKAAECRGEPRADATAGLGSGDAAAHSGDSLRSTPAVAAPQSVDGGGGKARRGVAKLQLSYWAHTVPASEVGVPELPITRLLRAAHTYGHGGFMGAALTFMADQRWRAIFKAVAPKDYNKAHLQWMLHIRNKASVQCKLMLTLENSPVLCAYGVVKSGACVLENTQAGAATTEGVPKQQFQAAAHQVKVKAAEQAAPSFMALATQLKYKQRASEQALSNDGSTDGGDTESHNILRLKALECMDSMTTANRYGYKPIALEWDIWMSPKHPERVAEATVDHGSPMALVTQAITTALPCCTGIAQSAGAKQILNMGISPAVWLTHFGRAINLAVHEDADKALPLSGPQGFCFRWHVHVQRGVGGATQQPEVWGDMYVALSLDGRLQVQGAQTKPAKAAPSGTSWDEELSLWPVQSDAPQGAEPSLRVELRGDPVGIVKDKGVGLMYLPLGWMLERCGWQGQGGLQHGQVSSPVEAWWQLGPKERKGERGSQAQGVSPRPGSITYSTEEPEVELIATTAGMGDETGVPERLRLVMKLEVVGHKEAAMDIGVDPAAAQTCLAMLAEPGGLYLDVKSAYSSAEQCMLFVGACAGMGVNAKAVCSFKPEQLPASFPNVLFFHGLNGLERACDQGSVQRGQWVLFNGASFLLDTKDMGAAVSTAFSAAHAKDPATGQPLAADAAAGHMRLPLLVDPFMWRQYVTLSERVDFVGGIYIQEPDASAAIVDALCKLVNDNPMYLPLGFAFGSVSGRAVSFPELSGRGFAAQQLLEELAANKELGTKVMTAIEKGENKRASPVTIISWGHRLLAGSRYMSRREQRLFLKLLYEMFPRTKLTEVVRKLGGPERIIGKFFETYEAYYPLNLYEQSFNVYYTKTMLRLLRNLGVLQSLTREEKEELGQYLTSSSMYGTLDTYFLIKNKIRKTLNKYAREGLCCLLESCTRDEAALVVAAVEDATGEKVDALLGARTQYAQRLRAVNKLHQGDAEARAYQDPKNKYASLEVLLDERPGSHMHTRDKTGKEKAGKAARKTGFLCLDVVYNLVVGVCTLFIWHLYYFGHLLYVAWHT